jgi:hypothetical protein
MKRQDQKHLQTLEPRIVERSPKYHDEPGATQCYRPPQVSFAGKAKRVMASGNSGNNYDCIQRYYFC